MQGNELPTVYLVRHGETDFNLDRKMQGRVDEPLNETGEQQSDDLATALSRRPLDKIYTSPLQRSKVTAEKIQDKHSDVELEVVEELVELDMGDFEGKTESELAKEYGQEWAEFRTHGYLIAAPGGEDLADASERLDDLPEKWAEEAQESHIAIVGHQGVNLAIKAEWLGIDVSKVSEANRLKLLELKQPNDRIDVLDPVAGLQKKPITA